MCCFFTSLFAFGPRLALVVWWILDSEYFTAVFDSVIWPILGIIFLPWTSIMYLIVWQPEGSIDGLAWLWLGLGVFLDMATHLGGGFRNRPRLGR